jgi:pilus assembly protein CpaE
VRLVAIVQRRFSDFKVEVRAPAARKEVAHLIPPSSPEFGKYLTSGDPGGERSKAISVAVVDRDIERRIAVTSILYGLQSHSAVARVSPFSDTDSSQTLIDQGFDVVLVAVDRDKEAALERIGALCQAGTAIPMAYSERTDDELLIRCMRAGVREFLFYPFAEGVIEEAFGRMASRSQLAPDTTKAAGKSFVFLGAKGGSGVTTAACNFAVSLAQESKRKTLLIDLDLPLGDASVTLGVNGEFSTLDALQQAERLDSTFLAKLLVKHKSGLHVLASPGRFLRFPPFGAAVDQLITVASQSFDYVVVDAGSKWELTDTRLFELVSKIYLVTQVGVAELRNSNRLITGCLQRYGSKLEIVLNRYTAELFGIDDAAIEGALTRPAQWRLPNDFPTVHHMRVTAEPMKESNIKRAIVKMAAAASGVFEQPQEKKKRFGLFGLASRA